MNLQFFHADTQGDSSSFGKRQYMLLSLLLVLYITATQFLNLQGFAVEYNTSGSTTAKHAQTADAATTEPTRLGDDCYHVFLDVGANVGVHGRFLLEPHKYPDTERSGDLFQEEYALKDNRNVCVFEFEANHRHWPRLDEISEAYAKMGWRYHVIHAAVSDQEGTTTFFHQGSRDEQFNEWGFSGAKKFNKNKGGEGGFEVTVPTVRLAEWINFHIHERSVPQVIGDRDKAKPVIGMKMDIEGFEYVVLPDMIHTGALCDIDFVFGEFHPHFAPIQQFRKTAFNIPNDSNTTEKDHRISLDTFKEARMYQKQLEQVMKASRNCDVRWINGDDESYLRDGQPLPTANNTSSSTTMGGNRLRRR